MGAVVFVFSTNVTHSMPLGAHSIKSRVATSRPTSRPADPAPSRCPKGFILVPGNKTYGMNDFCVAKYEMKATAVFENGAKLPVPNGAQEAHPGFCVADSRPDDTPWVNITRNQAEDACHKMGSGYRLISNVEWQTIARNIESNNKNWVDDRGTLRLPRGSSDDRYNVNQALAASRDDQQGCSGLADLRPDCRGAIWGEGLEQRRTHTLTNGEVIWDFGGNVWEWIANDASTTRGFRGVMPNLTPDPSLEKITGPIEYLSTAQDCGTKNQACFPLDSSKTNRDLFAPLSDFGSAHGMGKLWGAFGSQSESYDGAVSRGGGGQDRDGTGIYAAFLFFGPERGEYGFGFRCVTRPDRM